MSVKIKIILGFILIVIIVFIQSILIISTNRDKDALSNEILTLYQMNSNLKDRVIDAKAVQIDILNRIVEKRSIPTEKEQQPVTSAVTTLQGIEQWYSALLLSREYSVLDGSRKSILEDLLSPMKEIRSAVEKIRSTQNDDITGRMDAYNNIFYPAVNRFFDISKNFIGQNSLVFATKNKSLAEASEKIQQFQFLIIGIVILIIIMVIFYSQYILSPLNWLMEGVLHITKGNLSYIVRKRSNDELGRLATQFNTMSSEIRNHREHLEDLVQKRTEQLLEAKEELEKINDNLRVTNKNLEDARRIMDLDMKMAVNVQSSLFVKKAPQTDEWDISFYFKPMSGVSGDMYDFYFDPNNNLIGLSMMDVSGHGIASGLVTMIAKSISTRVFTGSYNRKLNQILEEINNELINELGNIDNYLTGILLKFQNEFIEYVNAGHTELLIRRGDLRQTQIIKPSDNSNYKGLFLGLEAMKSDFDSLTFKVNRDDVLLIFSDCLNESVNPAGEEYGIDRIIESLNKANGSDSRSILNQIMSDLTKFTETEIFDDDMTVICLKRKK